MDEPTVEDYIARAKAAVDEPTRAAAFEEAWNVAERGTKYQSSTWRNLLEALVASGAPDARIQACARRVVTASQVELDTWGFSEAISALRGIGAESEALDVLALARATLEAKSTRAYEWSLLARGLRKHQAIRSQVRALIDRGAEVAAERDDLDALATLAADLHALGDDPDGAVQLQQRADAMWRSRCRSEFRKVWGVANGWHALGRLAERDRLLADARSSAATLDDFLLLARIWKSHNDIRAAVALVDAHPLATSAEDWYEVAKCAHECKVDTRLISAALTKCKQRSPSPKLLALVEQSAHRWLGVHRDHTASLRAEDLRPRKRLLIGWPSSASALFDWLCDHMTAEHIELVARADYGIDFEGHRDAIATMVRDRVIPPVLMSIPREVISLYRWGTGERVDPVARAFCAAILLLYGDTEDAAAPLLQSIFTLDPGAVPRAIALLVHCHECEGDPEAPPDPPVVLYAIAIAATRAGYAPERIQPLVDACSVAAPALRSRLSSVVSATQWKSLSAAIAADSTLPALATLAATMAAP
ncbi:MAG: hypothetical protein SFX73_01785 [Kofleriaceae bacterium]|nr:hypothetical protein [Kofleriaceae bacterium]